MKEKKLKKRKKAPHNISKIHFSLPEKTKKSLFLGLVFLLAIIILLSFFDKAGLIGKELKILLSFIFGKSSILIFFALILGGIVYFLKKKDLSLKSFSVGILLLILGISGIFGLEEINSDPFLFENFKFNYSGNGGWIGYILSWPLLKGLGWWGSLIILLIFSGVGLSISLEPILTLIPKQKQKEKQELKPLSQVSNIIKKEKIFPPLIKKKEKEKELLISDFSADFGKKNQQQEEKNKKTKNFLYPPLDLLEDEKNKPQAGDIVLNSSIIKRTLLNFGIPVEMSEVNVGPTVTQYTLKPAEGVKLSKIRSLAPDLSLALAAHPIRIEAPIPGRSLVGIEIPNKKRIRVRLKDLLLEKEFKENTSTLLFALGRDVRGAPVFPDLSRMPHLLVAGSTGSGKTVALNSIILSLLFRNTPDDLRLILVDPKRVEFPIYSSLDYLICPVICDVSKTLIALKWLVQEMERRFEVLAQSNVRDIEGYNKKKRDEKLPYLVLIIDELADLMAARGKEIEAFIVRLAQMSRAVGIHLILATQRPSVEVITGLIKANITSRIAFQTASQIDSRTILDVSGAETLIGRGDLLFISTEIIKPKRVQGTYVSEKEVKDVVNWFLENQKEPLPKTSEQEELIEQLKEAQDSPMSKFDEMLGEEDPLYEEAKKVVIQSGKASASLLQRRLRVGYARAARLLDLMEERGLVGPADGAKPREVYKDNE